MNKDTRLILENQKIIMKTLRFGYELKVNSILGDSLCRSVDKTEEALSKESQDYGYEKDVAPTQSCPKETGEILK